MLKNIYVGCMRAARSVLGSIGVLGALERSDRPAARWVRSLFSIYDSSDMASLDTPWWTYSAIQRVDQFLAERRGTAKVFEYGAGASTIWLAKRAASVVSVEHDEAFLSQMGENFHACDNVSVRLVLPKRVAKGSDATLSQRKGYEGFDFTDYVVSIDQEPGQFDVIVIDGRARNACLAKALSRLAPDGMIIFDNSNRGRYRKAIALSGLRATVCRGLAPALPYPSETTILQVST